MFQRLRVVATFAIVAILLLALIALWTSALLALFTPLDVGWFLAVPAFLVSGVGGVLAPNVLKRGWLPFVAQVWPAIRRSRPIARAAIFMFTTLAAIGICLMVAICWSAGVAASTDVFAHREVYELNSHGRKTVVSRTRYVIAGASFVIGWHALPSLFATVGVCAFVWGPNEFASDATAENKENGDNNPPRTAD
jgi:hypothetical protein